MTVTELGEKLNLTTLTQGKNTELRGCYISDLLSRVMGGCGEDYVWITVQSSLNMVAVALMIDAACVILPEGLTAADNVLEKANEEGLAVFSSKNTAYELALLIAKLI